MGSLTEVVDSSRNFFKEIMSRVAGFLRSLSKYAAKGMGSELISSRALSAAVAIPEPFKWDESFAVFYARLDDEHRGLFDGIFAVAASPNDAAVLAALKTLVVNHFSYEESQYEKIPGYDVAGHKAKHAEFLKAAGPLQVPITPAQVIFMKQWLVDHITNTDFTYKGKI